MHDLPACDLCGLPAVEIVTDVEEIAPEDGYRRCRVHSRHPRCGADLRACYRYMRDGTVALDGTRPEPAA
jgi:hypothetical protein